MASVKECHWLLPVLSLSLQGNTASLRPALPQPILTMPTGDGAHKVENIAGQACLDGQGGTEPVSVVSVPALLI